MGKPTDLAALKYGFRIRPGVKPLKRPLKVLGFDSETDSDGRMTVLACSDGNYCLGEPIGDLLGFLTEDRYRFSSNFFYNLGYDTNALLKSVLSPEQLDRICSGVRVSCGRYSIETIRGKLLKIVRGGKVWRYYDIAGFYKGGFSSKLTDVYKATFGEEYVKRLDASEAFNSTDDETVRYCIEDAKACARLADNFARPANKLVPMDRFYSGASLAKKLRQKNLTAPYGFKISRLQQAAMNAYGGARIETFKRGGWGFKDSEKLYMYDIRSAYPSVQCGLDEVVCHKTSKNPEYEPEALHSFFRINVSLDEAVVSPLKYRFKGLIFYPVGQCADLWVDKNELELLMEYGMKYQIMEAEHDLSPPGEKPYAYLKTLYDYRMKCKRSKDLAERQLDFPLKTALASSYGILIERNGKMRYREKPTLEEMKDEDAVTFADGNGVIRAYVPEWSAGQYFNPVHACETTSAIRCRLFRDSLRWQEHLVKYATDSMTFDRKVSLDFGEGLGQYEDSPAYNQAIVVGCGVYSMVSEGRKVNRFRSFDSHNLIDLAMEHGSEARVEIVKKAPLKLKESRLERFIWFNTFQEKRKKLDLNFDRRRRWERRILDFNDLISGVCGSEALGFQDITGRRRTPETEPVRVSSDLVDSTAYYDSTLTASENRQIERDRIRAYMRG